MASPGRTALEMESPMVTATAVVEGLTKLGHELRTVRVNGGGYQGIMIDPSTNVLHGGSEARKDGCAVGY